MKSQNRKSTLILLKLNKSSKYMFISNLISLLIFIQIIDKISSVVNRITLKLISEGTHEIINSNFIKKPLVFEGDKQIEMTNNKININSKEEFITLVWNEALTNCSNIFMGLSNISQIDFTNFDSSSVIKMDYMFANCINLISINFKNFNTSRVTTIQRMFLNCQKITSLDLTNFDTSNIQDMAYMFLNCRSLTNLILSEFKNTLTKNMLGAFQNCTKLESLDLTKFYTPNVEIMWDLFNGASSLTSLNLFSFDTTKVTDMESMFDGCNSLVFLNLSHFKTNKVQYMNKMFRYCYKLKYLDFRNIDAYSVGTMEQMFYQCTSLIYINLYALNKESSVNQMFSGISNNFTYCINNLSSIPTIKSLLKNLNAIEECLNFTYMPEEEKPCTPEFPYKNEKNICVEKCSINDMQKGKCILNYTNFISESSLLIDNGQDQLDMVKDELINGFDTLSIDEGEDIVINNEDQGISYEITSSKNQKNNRGKNKTSINLGLCEDKLKEKYQIDKNDSLYILKIDKAQENMDISKIEYEVYYPLNKSDLVKLDLDACKDIKIEIIYPASINEKLDLINASSGFFNDICYTFTSENKTDMSLQERQKNFVENNKTKCEEGCEFKDYDEINKKAICSCMVKINLPLIKEISFDKEKLYNNFVNINNIANFHLMNCYHVLFTKEGISSNIGCFILIPIIVLYFICLIKFYKVDYKLIKFKINEIIYAKKNKKKIESYKRHSLLINSDNNFQKILNHKKRKKLKKNNKFGNEEVQTILVSKVDKLSIKSDDERIKNNQIIMQQNIKNDIDQSNKKTNFFINYLKDTYKLNINDISNPNKSKRLSIKKNNDSSKITNNNLKKLETSNNKNLSDNQDIYYKFSLMNKADKIKIINEILQYNDIELNILKYEEALKIDGRTFFSYYFSIIRTKNLLIFSFWPLKNDYNSAIVKIYLFFFIFTIYYTVNACFFNDKTLTKINEDEGSFNFIYQIPQILYSSLISVILNNLIKYFALSENNIVELKQEKNAIIFKKKNYSSF